MDQFHIKGNQERLNRLHLEGRNTKGYFENDHNNVGTSANAPFINYQNVFDKNPYRINEIDAINAIENINTISAINNDILALQVGSVNADSQQDSQIYNFKTSDLPLFSDESVCSSTNFDNTTIFTENVNKLAGLTLDTNKKLSDKTNYNLVNYNEELFSKIFDKNPNPFLNVGFYGDANQVLEKNQKPSYGFGDKVEGDMIFTPQPDMQINHDTIFTTKNKDVGILSATLGSDINDAMHNNEVDTFIKNYEMLDAQTLTLGSSGITGISSERVDQTHTLQTVIPAGFNFNHEGINRQNHFKNDAEHVLWKYEPQYSRSLNSTPNSLLFSKKPPRGRRVGSKSTKSKDMINAILQNKFNPQLINAAMRKTNFCNAKTTASDSGLQYKNNIYIPRYPPTSTEPNASDNPIPKFNGLVQVGMDHLNVCDVAVTKKQEIALKTKYRNYTIKKNNILVMKEKVNKIEVASSSKSIEKAKKRKRVEEIQENADTPKASAKKEKEEKEDHAKSKKVKTGSGKERKKSHKDDEKKNEKIVKTDNEENAKAESEISITEDPSKKSKDSKRSQEEDTKSLSKGDKKKKRSKDETHEQSGNARKVTEEDLSLDDASGSHKASLRYLLQWKNSKEQWKFQKARQNWLLRHLYDSEKVPVVVFDILVEYLGSIKGNQRVVILEQANKLCTVEESPKNDGEDKGGDEPEASEQGGDLDDKKTPEQSSGGGSDGTTAKRAKAIVDALQA
ncbi:hypothetical protein AX774_g321 [Zancudomyces culisetae]|uniref:WKF domain-containing protein n=1 Tax=Zancudomyces culisetae TaxID=1213189 RepID=A0A1R1PYP4_ZANCU|nr:hypothetical protein AX774_g321 [Zancudomyces culisetae]|eukprot:OMH86092.1 hypothetical protein AX774_g321 [Zancudomyces culisetae]